MQRAKVISVITIQTEEMHGRVKHCRYWDTALSKEDKQPDRDDPAQRGLEPGQDEGS